MFRRMIGGEFTKVSPETEIKIPKRTYLIQCLYGSIGIIGWFVVAWLIWILIWIQTRPFRLWFGVFSKWMSKNWPWMMILSIVWCITFPLILLQIRLSFEQIFKSWKPFDFNRK